MQPYAYGCTVSSSLAWRGMFAITISKKKKIAERVLVCGACAPSLFISKFQNLFFRARIHATLLHLLSILHVVRGGLFYVDCASRFAHVGRSRCYAGDSRFASTSSTYASGVLPHSHTLYGVCFEPHRQQQSVVAHHAQQLTNYR